MAGGDVCGDNRFEIIAKAKQSILDSTNIDTSPNEMKVLDNFLFRCWQMGWLDKYDVPDTNVGKWIPCNILLPIKNGVYRVTRQVEDGGKTYRILDASYFDGQNTWHDDKRVNHGREYLNDVIAWMPLPEPYKGENNG